MPQIKKDEAPTSLWIMSLDTSSEDPEIEAAESRIVIERTDEDEVAIHGMMDDEEQATVSLYLTRADACLVAARLLREAAS